MGEPKPKPPDILAQIRALQGKMQELETILTEQGVELEPDTPTSLQLRPGIGRVWATLWGRDKGSLRIIGVDRVGQLIARSPRWELCTTTIKVTNFAATGEITVDLGKVVDFVHLATFQCMFWAEFSMKGLVWGNRRYAHYEGHDVTQWHGWLVEYVRCQYVKLNCIVHGSGVNFDVIGETFPEQ